MDVSVVKLNKAFGAHVVLKDVSISFTGGKNTAIMGDSGCGKTTLLRILMGLEAYDSGKIVGVPEYVSAVFQEDRLLEGFNAVANIAFAADRGVAEKEILSHLDEVGLHESALQSVSEMSGGMRRRVAIVRAVLARKELLLLDEPLKGLDEQTRDKVAAYINRHSSGVTTIMVTHDADEVALMDASLVRMESVTGLSP